MGRQKCLPHVGFSNGWKKYRCRLPPSPGLRRVGNLRLEGEAVVGEVLLVAHLDELFLEGFVDGRALSFAVESGEMFFFAAGVDVFFAGRFL